MTLPTVTVRGAVLGLMKSVGDWIPSGFPAIWNAIITIEPESSLSEERLYQEFVPVLQAMGIQPVRNLWGNDMFERARQELDFLVRVGAEPTPEGLAENDLMRARIHEYLEVWRSWRPGSGDIPYDETTARALSHLGIGRQQAGDMVIVNPALVMAVSSVVVTFPGMFWKALKDTRTLI